MTDPASAHRRIGTCELCFADRELLVFKPTNYDVPPRGRWVCALCDPEEHEDFARGLVELGDEIGHRGN